MCALRRPSPTMLTANRGRRWLLCRLYVTKKWFCCQQNRQIQEDVSYPLGSLFVTLRGLVPSRPPFSDTPMSCGTPCWPPNCWLVTVLLQGNVRFHFAFFRADVWGGEGGGGGELGKVLEINESCFSWLKCNCGRLCDSVGLCSVEQESGRPVLHLWLNASPRRCLPSLRRVLDLIAYCSLALFM
jgi:hypothetical protein